jgi:hypothetical protein
MTFFRKNRVWPSLIPGNLSEDSIAQGLYKKEAAGKLAVSK